MCFVLTIVPVAEMFDTVEHLMISIEDVREDLIDNAKNSEAEISNLKAEISNLKADISNLKAEMSQMNESNKAEMHQMKESNKKRNIAKFKAMIDMMEDDDT